MDPTAIKIFRKLAKPPSDEDIDVSLCNNN